MLGTFRIFRTMAAGKETNVSMSDRWERYVERWGMRFEESGLPRSAGRIWGWLLVCRPETQSLGELCRALEISKATASTSSRLLEQLGLLERVAVPGSRESHYRQPPDAFEVLIRRRLEETEASLALAEEGMEMAAGDEGVPPDRLELLRDFYAFVRERQRESLEAWRARKEERGGSGGGSAEDPR